MSFGHRHLNLADAPERIKQPVFIAAVVDDASSEALVALAHDLGLAAPIAAHHLTLGYVPKGGALDTLVAQARHALRGIDVADLALHVDGVDTFGWKAPAAVVDLDGDTAPLHVVAADVKAVFGLDARELRPHLTLEYGVEAPEGATAPALPVRFAHVSVMWGRTGDYTCVTVA